MFGAEADAHINTRPCSVNTKDAHEAHQHPCTSQPLHRLSHNRVSQKILLLCRPPGEILRPFGWWGGGLPATSQLSPSSPPALPDPQPLAHPANHRQQSQRLPKAIFLKPGLTRQHRGKVVMFYFGISLICSRWLKEFLFFKSSFPRMRLFTFMFGVA